MRFTALRRAMHKIALSFAVLAAGTLAAQTYNYAPSGHATLEGNSNNTIPWWAGSATYQQIHDAGEMAVVLGSSTATINSINLRKDGDLSAGVPGRTLDLEITLGHTSVNAAAATTTFATNLGGTPAVVLPYTNINLPSLSNSSIPNPVGWQFPFTTPFAYNSATGNLCWEFRMRNSSTTAFAAMDAAWSETATGFPPIGRGCVATGQSSPAAIGLSSLTMATGDYRNRLDRGAASTPAAFFLGVTAQQITLPGLCSSLETFPLATVPGGTDATGTWDLTLTFGSLIGTPATNIYGQFVFFDAGLPLGLGLSNASRFLLPPASVSRTARIWFGAFNSGQGNETALTGIVGTYYGLITIFGT